ncbi:hypothetical protein QJS10_CPB19g00327 [Acorus calamus]|uniref:Uncharacterized protein n=1 Tax=Acorus calamus TaxID=4465 RepID=A0AAV9CGV2_ACOCL|nr:hypothetical protein QJS10_CPB19g00327 [Acorus calamus]
MKEFEIKQTKKLIQSESSDLINNIFGRRHTSSNVGLLLLSFHIVLDDEVYDNQGGDTTSHGQHSSLNPKEDQKDSQTNSHMIESDERNPKVVTPFDDDE